MSYAEQAIAFACGEEQLLGILSQPAAPASMGVVIIVGGPQYRAGSHRQFVLLARALAAAGIAVLRFDYRGMGDSSGTPVDFLHADADIRSAIDTLCARSPTVTRVALWGLCDAAAAALLYCEEVKDSRVAALCLLNPWVRSQASLARTQVKHYYTQRLRERAFWVKLLSGKVAWGALTGLIGSIRLALRGGAPHTAAQAPFQTRMARAWRGFGGPILLILSGTDLTAKEFLDYAGSDGAWSGALTQPNLSRHDLATADHTFSAPESTLAVEALTLAWLTDIASGQAASA